MSLWPLSRSDSARRCRRQRLLPVFLLVSAALSGRAGAQARDGQFPAERMRTALDREGVIGVESGAVPRHLQWSVGLWGGWSAAPVVLYDASTNERLGSLVGGRAGGGLVASVGLFDRVALGVEAPFVLHQSRGTLAPGAVVEPLPALSAQGFGDVRVAGKVGLLRAADGAPLDVALQASFTLPSGGGHSYLGEAGATVTPELAVSRSWNALRVAANAGVAVRHDVSLVNQRIGHEVLGGLGAAYRFAEAGGPPIELGASVSGAFSALRPFENANETPLEARGQVGWAIVPGLELAVGAGAGLHRGWGTPDWRVFTSLRFTSATQTTPPPPAPPVDTDGDGIDDAHDRCPAEPEDRDGFEDADGCPDPDNDQDGVLDADDACPLVAGVAENRGCPDSDRDGDGVVDRLDNCPDEPGEAALQGCVRKQLVALGGASLDLFEPVRFEFDRDVLHEASHEVLIHVARVLRDHPGIELVDVEGHTDGRGIDSYNLELSQRRADAVVRFLTNAGIKAARLRAKGYGSQRPIATNDTVEGREKNRRVAFSIVRRAPGIALPVSGAKSESTESTTGATQTPRGTR